MTATQYMKKGQVVFHEGSRSDFAFIIENGQVEVSRRRKDGNVEVLDILGRNEIFGAMGMVDGGPRTATITALENSKVTMITREDLNLMRRSTTKEKKYLRNAGLVRNK